ncbi:MAG: SMP-30/gluconolactonase/LRE family protein [Actinomycetia bacterium]|nr:SMP-30/gluconolactonase/LRE family protein [Actinomycetes bacterium]
MLLSTDGTRVLTGTKDGSIWSLTPDGGQVRRVAHTGGRPLGLEWLPDGRLLVCDADAGLLAVDLPSGRIEELLTEVDGVRLRFTNNAAVADDGTIYVSDSSRHYGVEEWKSDLIAHTRTGRLLRRSPDGTVTTLLGGLAFANGVALTPDGSQVWVAETALSRIRRLDLQGRELGRIDGLAGYPDNIALGSDGLIWVALAAPPDPVLGLLQGRGAPLRPLALRLPEALKPTPKRTVRVAAFDASGLQRHDISVDAARWHMATGVREHDGAIWLGSLVEPALAVLETDGGPR